MWKKSATSNNDFVDGLKFVASLILNFDVISLCEHVGMQFTQHSFLIFNLTRGSSSWPNSHSHFSIFTNEFLTELMLPLLYEHAAMQFTITIFILNLIIFHFVIWFLENTLTYFYPWLRWKHVNILSNYNFQLFFDRRLVSWFSDTYQKYQSRNFVCRCARGFIKEIHFTQYYKNVSHLIQKINNK